MWCTLSYAFIYPVYCLPPVTCVKTFIIIIIIYLPYVPLSGVYAALSCYFFETSLQTNLSCLLLCFSAIYGLGSVVVEKYCVLAFLGYCAVWLSRSETLDFSCHWTWYLFQLMISLTYPYPYYWWVSCCHCHLLYSCCSWCFLTFADDQSWQFINMGKKMCPLLI